MNRIWIFPALVVCLCLAAGSAAAQDDRLLDFWAACRNGEVAKVREFLDSGMDPNARFDAGMTPLGAAAMRGQVEVAKVLVERGASLTVRDDSYRMTPLGMALFSGKPEMVNFLLERSREDMDVVLIFGVFRNQPGWVEAALKTDPGPAQLTRALAIARNAKREEIAATLEAAGAKAPPALTQEQLQRFAGTYQDATQMELEAVLRDGKLIGTGGSGFEAFFEQELVPLSENLVFVSSDPTMTFQFAGSGPSFDRVRLVMPGASHDLKRTGGKGQ